MEEARERASISSGRNVGTLGKKCFEERIVIRPVAALRVVRTFLTHPIGRRDPLGTIRRMLYWQVGSRLLKADVAMPFIKGTRLLVRTGMHGATGNVYVGLVEFADMAFVLHFLREGDFFLDVGANVGVYSILAGSTGARVLALEPVPGAYEVLVDNICLNRLQGTITAKNVGAGSRRGELVFSKNLGAKNHVLPTQTQAASGESLAVAVEPLDELASDATLLKIDVEGYETEVLNGAPRQLSSEKLQAIIVELNGLSKRYGFSDEAVHARLRDLGFAPVKYDPFARDFTLLTHHNRTGNTLYVRDIEECVRRVRSAEPLAWQGFVI